MKEFKYVVTDPEGIHARPAGMLVKAVKEFSCDIKIAKDGKAMNCKAIFGIMGLAGWILSYIWPVLLVMLAVGRFRGPRR